MKNVDLLIINNCPAFYKINLYNEIAKKVKIHVEFIGLSDQVVIDEKFKEQINFSYNIIHNGHIDNRNKFIVLIRLLRVLQQKKYKKIIYGGWDLPELRILLFLSPKKKNCKQVESSIKESKVSGFVAFIKKILITRISTVLASGKLQADIYKALNFKGNLIYTKGVGIFDKQKRKILPLKVKDESLKYLYVGRLIDKKNIRTLIEEFNSNGKKLTIVGEGCKEMELKSIAKNNIAFLSFIPNNELGAIYSSHNVFVLPSFSEPWGLVVEEAIYYGLPVIVSDAVGCQSEMVVQPNTGIVFNLNEINGLKKAIAEIENKYEFYKANVQTFDFKRRDQMQVIAYQEILK